MTKTGNATSYALRGLLVILVALGSLAPVTPSIASRGNPPGPAPRSQAAGGQSDDASGPAPLRADAMAFATAVYLRQRAVLDAVAEFDSSLGAIIRASDDALRPDDRGEALDALGDQFGVFDIVRACVDHAGGE